MAELIDVPDGLAGVVAAETEISDVVGDHGFYHYRGRSAPDLATSTDFESAANLILTGDLQPLRLDRRLPEEMADLIGRVDLRVGLAALASTLDLPPLSPGIALDREAATADAARLIGAYPTLVASVLHGRVIEADPSLGHVADYLRMLGGGEPASAEAVTALQTHLVLTMDHGFNNSTFAARVVASAGADLGACVLAGFGSLNGPRHGANVERMLDMYDAIGEPERARSWMEAEMAARRRISGFGHAVYRLADPRLDLLREQGAIVAPERHAMATAVEEAGLQVLAGRNLVPNLDLHAAVVLEGAGVPRGWFTATFAVARITAWCAHAIEQAGQAKIVRPAARYVGPPPDRDVY